MQAMIILPKSAEGSVQLHEVPTLASIIGFCDGIPFAIL